jgi:hypothetical protein
MDDITWFILLMIAVAITSGALGYFVRGGTNIPPDIADVTTCERTCFPDAAAVAFTPATGTWTCTCYDTLDPTILRIRTEKK